MGTIANVLVGSAVIKIDTVDVGYTIDGVTLTVSSDFADIQVEELVGTIIRKLVGQTVQVTLTMAEGSLANLAEAIPGSVLAGTVLTLGGGALQEVEIELTGEKPGGGNRVITLDNCNPTGEVGIPYKKGEASVVPVTFSALVSDLGVFGTIDDT
jgi:hypothetical protein